MRIFTGNAHPKLGNAICNHLSIDPGRCEVGHFADGESKVRILDDVRGLDVFIVQSTCPPVNEALMELLVMVDALRRASAKRITAVVPYFGYARQDRKHEGRVPITAKLTANLITAAGVDRIVCVDLHAAQIQGFFDIPLDHLYGSPVIKSYLKDKEYEDAVVVSPDVGSMKMAHGYAKALGYGLAVVEKRRLTDMDVEAGYVIGDLKNKDVVLVDDMISTAGSMASAIAIARDNGAKSVTVCATHGLFVGPAYDRLLQAKPDEIVVTDTVPLPPAPEGLNVTVLSVAKLLAEAIMRIHHNKSLSLLFV